MKWNQLTDDIDGEELTAICSDDVLFAVDEQTEEAIIADISTDDAWISAPTADARTLTQWR